MQGESRVNYKKKKFVSPANKNREIINYSLILKNFPILIMMVFLFFFNIESNTNNFLSYTNCSTLKKLSSIMTAAKNHQNSNPNYIASVAGDITNYDALSHAEGKEIIIGVRDDTSKLSLKGDTQAASKAQANNGGKAYSDAKSTAATVGMAVDNSEAKANVNSKVESGALSNAGVSASQAETKIKAEAKAVDSGTAVLGVESDVKSQSKANIQGDSQSEVTNNIESKNEIANKIQSLYLGDPTRSEDQDFLLKAELNSQGKDTDSLSSNNQIKTDEFTDWESVYRLADQIKYRREKHNSEVTLNIIENNPNLIDMKFPEIIHLSQNSQNQENSQKAEIFKITSSYNINFRYTELVAIDITIDSQGHAYAAGLDGQLYEYIKGWEKVEGLTEVSAASSAESTIGSIVRVAAGLDATPYVVTGAGSSYYLNCNHRWEQLPGCARDIAAGRGGEVFKVGCEKRKGGFRIYKLVCEHPCGKCKKCLRYLRSDKINSKGVFSGFTKDGNRERTTPGEKELQYSESVSESESEDNQKQYKDNSKGSFSDSEMEEEDNSNSKFHSKINSDSKSEAEAEGDNDDILNTNSDTDSESSSDDKETCNSDYSFSYEREDRRCNWFNMDGGAVRIAVHPNGNPFVITETGSIEYYNGVNWVEIPDVFAIDLSISNEGVLFFISRDYSVYRLIPSRYMDDYTIYNIVKLEGEKAIAITAGPYSQPWVVGEGYKVYSSSQLGYN